MFKVILSAFFALLLSFNAAHAASPSEYFVLIDEKSELSIFDVLHIRNDFSKTHDIANGYASPPIWLQVPLENSTSSKKTHYLKFAEPFARAIDLFVVDANNKILQRQRNGAQVAQSNRDVPIGVLAFAIELPANSSVTAFMKVVPFISSSYNYEFFDNEVAFLSEQMFQTSLNFIVLTILGIAGFISAILLLISRKKLYLFYIGYALSSFLFISAFQGVWAYSFIEVAASSSFGFMLLFQLGIVKELFEFKKNYRGVFNAITLIQILFLVVVFLYLLLPLLVIEVYSTLVGLMTLALLLSVIFAVVKKAKYSHILLIGQLILFVGMSVVLINKMAIGAVENQSIWMLASIAIEVMFFTIVMGLRFSDEEQVERDLLFHQSRLSLQGEMLQMVAHQWRQPLNQVSLMTQVLARKYDASHYKDPIVKQTLESLPTTVIKMSQTIDQFTNFFKKSSQSNVSKFSLYAVLQVSLDLVEAELKRHQIKVTKNFEDIVHVNLQADKSEVGQVIINVLQNAIEQFNDSAASAIDSKELILAVKDSFKEVELHICDNAGEIPIENLQKIFDPYFSTKGERHGQGLGLFLSKSIMQGSIGGNLEAFNENGCACFKFRFPKDLFNL